MSLATASTCLSVAAMRAIWSTALPNSCHQAKQIHCAPKIQSATVRTTKLVDEVKCQNLKGHEAEEQISNYASINKLSIIYYYYTGLSRLRLLAVNELYVSPAQRS